MIRRKSNAIALCDLTVLKASKTSRKNLFSKNGNWVPPLTPPTSGVVEVGMTILPNCDTSHGYGIQKRKGGGKCTQRQHVTRCIGHGNLLNRFKSL